MSLLINSQSLSKAFGSQILFKELSLSISTGDRIGLIGPNGAGKSTFLKILAGIEDADQGSLAPKSNLKIGYVPQVSEFPDISPLQVLLENQIEVYFAEMWLTKLGFKGTEVSAATLSGGWKRRLAIAKAMSTEPDILLLDEPTNHLDLEGVLWLEKFLQEEVNTFIAVSHDRSFLQNITNRIVEINPLYPKGLFAIKGSYESFLEKKELFIEGQAQQERSIATKARRESAWLRQNPKARTTKSQSRIDQAEEIFEEHGDIKKRNLQKNVALSFQSSGRETRKLVVAKNIKFGFNDTALFEHLDITLVAGMRLGLLGSNGSGKTTFLKLLAEELEPMQGTIKRADNLKIVYFDQHRTKLPDHITLHEALAPNGDYVFYNNHPIHVNGWCKRFLFSPTQLGMPIGTLSGGERARISIAQLMLKPADLLLLDEPTNDLDIPTLQVLEENLVEFPGAIVLITHDRYMLQEICNTFLALIPGREAKLYQQYSEWERAQEENISVKKSKSSPSTKRGEGRSIKQIEKSISDKEKKLHELNLLLDDSKVVSNAEHLADLCKKIADFEAQIDLLYKELEKCDV